jgi:AraC-like DNA-binding protein
MHGNPGHPWQLEELARAAGMSRTSFAVYFREVAGIPPLTYLAEWRMQSARQRLLEEDVPVATLAEALGYASESAFSNAFKRHTGLAPKRYRQGALATAG